MKGIPFFQGIDIGHRRQQEEEEFDVLRQVMHDRGMGLIRFTEGLIREGDQDPDDSGGDNDRLAFAQVELFLHDDHRVSNNKEDQGKDRRTAAGQIDDFTPAGRRQGGLRRQEGDRGHPEFLKHLLCVPFHR